MNVLISACLLGVECNYKKKAHKDWSNRFSHFVNKAKDAGLKLIPVCPEQLGGLTTPRAPAELKASAELVLDGKGRIDTIDGADVTKQFIHGAQQSLHLAKLFNVKFAIMASNSPSCGVKRIHDGTFSNNLIVGSGITTKLLIANGIRVFNENKILKITSGTDDIFAVFRELNSKH